MDKETNQENSVLHDTEGIHNRNTIFHAGDMIRVEGEEVEVAENCCARCKFEMTCGYSLLRACGVRSKYQFTPCCLGERSYSKGPFFEPREIFTNETPGGNHTTTAEATDLPA